MRDAVSPGLDPVTVRASLEASRDQGLSFDEAWRIAVGRRSGDDPATVKFMCKHFRAAYYNTISPAGRCMVPERDVSHALGVVRERTTRRDHERCQSGDGCERVATHGRHGLTWCEHHFVELERVREAYEIATRKAAGSPRIDGTAGVRLAA
ncbi:MAG: hypothetical protein RB191_24380 [Terriglobia bacterium]|nr:hypothetical protein [Terriglobia bacterium]